MKGFLIVFVFSAIVAGVFCEDPAPWTPVDWKTLPEAKPADPVDVYYVTAPLLEDEFGIIGKELNLYHGAIAFSNRNSGFNITVNYDASDFFRATLFPKIITYSNGSKDLFWENGGACFIYLGINTTYFTGIDLVTTVNGSIYNDFIANWNSQVNDSQPFYNMFGVADHYRSVAYLSSWDCFDYAWAAFQALSDRGAKFNPTQNLTRNFVYLYSGVVPVQVTELYYNNTEVHQDIIDFYEFTQAAWGKLTWTEFLITVLETMEGGFYLRYSDDYYKLDLHYPFAGFHFDPVPPTSTAFTKTKTNPDSRYRINVSL